MKPQTAAYLDNARESLSDAKRILAIDIPRQAGRLAYYAQFHAAQALIFERTGKVAKTHKGVRVQFHQLTRSESALDPRLAGELTAAYHLKEAADYETRPTGLVTSADARDAIASAERFLAGIEAILSPPPSAAVPPPSDPQ